MRAIMVAVDYADLLAVTLPYNLHHFEEVWIITDVRCAEAVGKVAWEAAKSVKKPDITVLPTELFYANNAAMNKWAALEWGLDQMGRHGWLCLLDADVLWPREFPVREMNGCPWDVHALSQANIGRLFSPLRRMWSNFPDLPPFPCNYTSTYDKSVCPLPLENDWSSFPIHRNVGEWAGYTQIFHASDPVLGPPPWHEVDWRHGGGADSAFQAKWAPQNKVRPPWECLHLGEAGQNWYGRATPYLDGTVPKEAAERRRLCNDIWRNRRGKSGPGRFEGEKLR